MAGRDCASAPVERRPSRDLRTVHCSLHCLVRATAARMPRLEAILGEGPRLSEQERRYRERSLWLDQHPEPLTPRASLPVDASCDVAIVGAGFTGLWTAYYLKRLQPDLRVVVLEREIAGFGPSGRNGGWASAGIAGSPAVYARRHGRDSVLRGTRETQRGVDEIGRVAREERIDCGYVKSGIVALATTKPQQQRLETFVRGQHAWGLKDEDVRLLSPREAGELVRAAGVLAASFSPH